MDKIHSMVVLRIRVFVSISNDVLPNDDVYVKEESVNSNILQSVSFKVLRRVCLLSLNMGLRRRLAEIDSTSETQLQNEFK